MIALVRNTLHRLRWHIIGWSLGLSYLGAMIVAVARTVSQMSDLVEQMVASFPEGLIQFFGGLEGFATPPGFVDSKFFSQLPLLLAIFAVAAGSSLLLADEEQGTLDLLLGHPISRSRLYVARVLGLVAASLIVLGSSLLATIIPLFWVEVDLSAYRLALAFLPALVQVLFMASLTVMLSQVLPSRRATAYAAAAYLVGGYFIDGFSHLVEQLEPVARMTPFYWYQSGEVMTADLKWGWLGGLIAFSLLFLLIGWWRFQRRDIRVSGEGGWDLPILRRLARRRPTPAAQNR